jgi:2-polyprenyl-3-methyl-5-hydroxy-6-metoxy-1,4-benzoquinol methylase
MVCLVCSADTRRGLSEWHSSCTRCGYEAAALTVAINEEQAHSTIDEAQREASLKALRMENFATIVGWARAQAPGARTLLDVGSAHGWFLDAAAPYFQVAGVEPDAEVGGKSIARGLPVRLGYFPDALGPDERFDIIVFNDVIEHIPSIRAALQACRERLTPGGTLILNLPNSRGLFYRLSKLFAAVGLRGPFERMWQKDMPSPHVHYFNPKNLTKLLESAGFELRFSSELAAIKAEGLYERIAYAGQGSKLKLWAQYLAILCSLPVLKLFPSDIIVCIYRKR